jgi:hypothetical protein
MQTVSRMVQDNYFKIMILLLAGGFAMLLAELLMLDHTDGIQLVAVVASVTGLIVTIAALFVRGRAATIVVAVLLALSATGLFGAYEHLENREAESAGIQGQAQPGNQLIADYQENESEADEGQASPPPPLAPLSLAGLSLVAAITVFGAPRKE